MGGLKTFREAWRHYYDDPHHFIYVIDSSEEDRHDEHRQVLKRLLREEKIQNKSILMYKICLFSHTFIKIFSFYIA